MDDWVGRWHDALRVDDAVPALRAVVVDLLDGGADRDEAHRRLQEFASSLDEPDRDAGYDAVLDVLDMLVGWCGPQARIE